MSIAALVRLLPSRLLSLVSLLNKRMTNRLSGTNVTRLLLACFVEECEVLRKVFSNKIIVTLVTQGLPSSFLSRPVA